MAKYWAGKPKQVEGALVPMFGCHVFTEARSMAICNAYGRTEDEAHTEAQRIIACLYAVERLPSAAAKARHYIVRSPVLPEPDDTLEDYSPFHAQDAQIWTQERSEYEGYFEACEKANKRPKTFDEWKAGNRG